MSVAVRTGLDPVTRILAFTAMVLGAYLYLGRLDLALLQRGNEAWYACPPIRMLETGDYLVPRFENHNFLDKPPLALWILAASYRLLGISVFAEKLPSALAGLGTAVLLGWWVRRHSSKRLGLLAALILMFSLQFVMVSVTFAADSFLAVALTVAVFRLDAACRRKDGSDLSWGVTSGAALAFAFYFKGLVGIVLPVGAVAAGLLFDRSRPVRLRHRGAWMLGALFLLLAPWHWAMTRRLGMEFWRVFYWENQFLRGGTHFYMQSRDPLFYVGALAWGAFPWSFLLVIGLARRRPSSVFLGWFVFGLAFWSVLVMKREIYLATLLPAVAALVAEGLGQREEHAHRWLRLPWILAALAACSALFVWIRAFRHLAELGGSDVAVTIGVGLTLLAAALTWGTLAPRDPRTPFGAALACGVFLLSLQSFELRLARFDPLPSWGERVRKECAEGCDGFLYGVYFTSIHFYSRFDWIWLRDPVRELPMRLRHKKGFILTRTELEPSLAGLPLKWKVLERRPAFRGPLLSTALGLKREGIGSLSLVRVEAVGTGDER